MIVDYRDEQKCKYFVRLYLDSNDTIYDKTNNASLHHNRNQLA